MKKILSLALLAVMLLSVSCVKGEKFADESLFSRPGVYGYLAQPVSDDPDTKATFSTDMRFAFEIGDHINIWSEVGTLLIYSVSELTPSGGAVFTGGGFTLTDGMSYYTLFPLISSFKEGMTEIPVSYDGQVQTADGSANHVAEYSQMYASATCENGSTHFSYRHLSRWVKFELTLPKNMTVTELTLTADSPVFAKEGKVNVMEGTFTPTVMTDTMTLKFKNVKVNDGVLNAFIALSTYSACNVVVSVKDNQGNIYSSPVVSQNSAVNPGNYRIITQTLTEDSSAADAVARIGLVTYPSLAAAVAAVPYSAATPTTITMIGDESISGSGGVDVDLGQNVILDLNGHTISQTGPMTGNSYLIWNFGSLSIKDSSDSAQDGSGTGKITVTSGTNNYDSYLLRNVGELNIESGYLEMKGSSRSRVVLNLSKSNTSITGGKLKNDVNGAYVVEMDLNSTTNNNRLNIGGTAVLEGNGGVWICYGSDDANKGELNITGGTFNTAKRAVYSSQEGASTSLNAAGLSVNISGGYFGGLGVGINAFRSLQYLVVSGGHFASLFVSSAGGRKFVMGGEYESVEEMIKWRLPEDTPIGIGHKVVYDGDLYYVVLDDDPGQAVDIFPANQIAYWWEGSSKSGYDFYAPFDGPDPILCADEYLELVMDINLTRDVTYIEEADWCTPIFQGGTFYLKFGEFDINLNGYAFPLPTGVSVKTDRQTDIFTALELGYIVTETAISDGDYHYLYSVTAPAAGGVAAIGSVIYPSLAAAVAAVPTDGTPTTITMIGNETITGDSGIEIGSVQNIILDLNGHTISHSDPEGETNRLLLNHGTLTIKDSSDSAKDGSGSGKIIVDPGPGTGVYEYGIANAGVLNIESGYFEMGGTQAGSSVINNGLNSNTTITGGKFSGYAYGVRMSLNSTSTDNILNVGGTAVFEGNIGIYVEYADGNANRGDLNITGGTFNTTGRAVHSAEYGDGTTYNASGLSVNISGGTFGGRGVALNAFSPLRSISVSGGHFASFTVQAAGGIKFITGGEFESVTEMIRLHFPNQTPIADGYKAVYENDLYIVVPESDPRPAVSIFPDNMVAYKLEGGSWYSFNFYELFEGPNVLLCTDEYIALVMDINLTRDVTYVQSADWCTPIFQGGTFYLRFGDFDIHLNGYAFPLPAGVSVKTDRQTDIFTALTEGATVTVTEISEEEYHYVYSVTQQTEPVIDEPGQW